ncbi:MAG: hypothetical protein IK125_06040 [Lachnospiraceae bacterium]|nr:hypothetical protein [Lachnospiraceae bacterium]
MKKQTTVEVLLDKCPSCGAPRVGNEATCHYCGCSMIQTRRIIEEVEDPVVPGAAHKDDRKVDIISEVEPPQPGAAGAQFVGVAFLIVWCVAAIGMGSFALKMGAGPIFTIVPFGMALIGVVMFAAGMMNVNSKGNYNKILREGCEYPAVVLGYGQKPFTFTSGETHTVHSILKTQVKVLADIDGRETCILLNAPASVSELTYPVGSTIMVVGLDGRYIVK